MKITKHTLAVVAASVMAASQSTHAALVLLDQFISGQSFVDSAGFDHTANSVWIYSGFATTVLNYSPAGTFLSSVARPGEGANDVDIEFAPQALTLGSTPVPSGTLLFINGETGVADIYAVNKTSGAVLATLNTSFGVSHVVGGAYHPGRNTFFLVQDGVPGGTDANRIAEIDPVTGSVMNSFQTTGIFAVNFGDLDVSAVTGNLLVVSSTETRIAELTPSGALVQYLPLPAGVSSLSGIGYDDALNEAWVSSTSGTISRIGGFPNVPEPSSCLLLFSGALFLFRRRPRRDHTCHA